MIKGANKYISKKLIKVIEEEQKKLKHNKRVKSNSFVKASEIVARKVR